MVRDSVTFFRAEGRRVFLDCEHFFDGFRFDPTYTAQVAATALAAGAEVAVMCDTNGGMLPSMVTRAIGDVSERVAVLLESTVDEVLHRLGIHCQNDTSCAVANTVAAVEAGPGFLAPATVSVSRCCSEAAGFFQTMPTGPHGFRSPAARPWRWASLIRSR